ncbi:tetratricopeptide repeat protein [Desulfotomaculum sp. 1211_IL3151]|uniref:tetratricopeptide repeat protein n=1 Tax=Desulfotomaculum sp. 1211_IL3151 TaxID=3084055 RepID=UPI002FD96BEA
MISLFFRKRKNSKMQRIVLGVLAAVLSFGLLASSIAWTGLGGSTDPGTPTTLQERIKNLEEQAKKTPEDKGLLASLASHYTQAGKIDKASEAYQKIVKLDPKDVSARQNLALLYYTQGKLEAAEQELKSALAVEPDNADLNYQYAKLLAEKKDYKTAITHMEKFLTVQSKGPKAEEAHKSIETWQKEAGQ